ncbi:MAG TPA: type 1 glutamine amidotransferase [Actinomycetota bacterium]|nr:type 1 glutamine amidotransferase [Actinomycetota bacterium]
MPTLAVIRHQETCPLGVVEDALVESGAAWHYVDVFRNDEVPAIDEVAGLIVLGGVMNVDETGEFPFLAGVRDLVAVAVDTGTPVLGICLGAQVLARAAGSDVHRAPEKEIGFVEVATTPAGATDAVASCFAPTSRVFQFHEDAIALPEGAELLVTGTTNRVQAFRIGTAYGFQFHFEVTEDEIVNWSDDTPDLATEWGVTKDELLAAAKEHLAAQQDAGRHAARAFLDLVLRP